MVSEALRILEALNVPREQQNERSALTLLALVGMTPRRRWADAEAPMLGITEMMNHFHTHFGTKYAPNTRETVAGSPFTNSSRWAWSWRILTTPHGR